MLTFEDFFKKKKINLELLQQAEPALFAEFNQHYFLMGEKSFDHTKKYWFNNLRRSYPLVQEIKPHAVQAEAISQMAVQGMAVAAAQNLDAAIERPKFKEDNLSELVEANVPEGDISLLEIEKSITEAAPEPATEPAKPAFKPRFNAKNIKKPVAEVTPEQETENPEPATEPAKPAFKPRFNMQNIKKEPIKTASGNEVINPEPATENPEPATEKQEAKPVYKPRFQMKNVKPATEIKAGPETDNPGPTTEP